MSNVTMEQKLQLLRQVRSRYHENQYDLSNRERILYGKTNVTNLPGPYSRGAGVYDDSMGEPMLPEAEGAASFRLRFLLVLFLVAAVIIMDKNGLKVAGITSGKIFEAISADYEEMLEAWAESYSFPSK